MMPISTISMEMTVEKMGRSIKNPGFIDFSV